MKSLTGSKIMDEAISRSFPDGVDMKLSQEEYMLIHLLRREETSIVEVKKKENEIRGINATDYFITSLSNAERIIARYKGTAEVSFTPIGKDNYQVKVISRFK